MKAIFKTTGKVVGGLCILGLTACSKNDLDHMIEPPEKAARTELETTEAQQMMWVFWGCGIGMTHRKTIGYAPGDSATIAVTITDETHGVLSDTEKGLLHVRDRTGRLTRSDYIKISKTSVWYGM